MYVGISVLMPKYKHIIILLNLFKRRFHMRKAMWKKGLSVAMAAAMLAGPVNVDRKSTRLNSSHIEESRMPSSA